MPSEFCSFTSVLPSGADPSRWGSAVCGTGFARRLAVGLMILLLTASCAGIQGQKADLKDLRATVEAFTASLRWGDFQAASIMVPEHAQDMFWEDAEVFQKDTRIANLEIRSLKLDGTSARAQIAVSYYRLSDPSFRSVVLHQSWRFHPERQAWLVEDSQFHRLLP